MVGRLLMLPAGVNFKSCTRLFPCHRWDRESVQHPTQHSTSATLFHGGYVPLQQRKARYVRKRGCFEHFQGFLKCWNLTHDLYRRCSDRSEMCNYRTLVQLHWKSVWNSTLMLVVLRWHHGRERVKDATLWQWIDKSVVKGDPTAYKVNKNAVYCVMVYSILLNLFMQLDLVLEDWQSFLFQILFQWWRGQCHFWECAMLVITLTLCVCVCVCVCVCTHVCVCVCVCASACVQISAKCWIRWAALGHAALMRWRQSGRTTAWSEWRQCSPWPRFFSNRRCCEKKAQWLGHTCRCMSTWV